MFDIYTVIININRIHGENWFDNNINVANRTKRRDFLSLPWGGGGAGEPSLRPTGQKITINNNKRKSNSFKMLRGKWPL